MKSETSQELKIPRDDMMQRLREAWTKYYERANAPYSSLTQSLEIRDIRDLENEAKKLGFSQEDLDKFRHDALAEYETKKDR